MLIVRYMSGWREHGWFVGRQVGQSFHCLAGPFWTKAAAYLELQRISRTHHEEK